MSNPIYEKLTYLDDIEIYKLMLSGKISRFPRGFWERPNALISAKNVTKYLIENILKWSNEDIKKKFNQKILFKYKLRGMLTSLFRKTLPRYLPCDQRERVQYSGVI